MVLHLYLLTAVQHPTYKCFHFLKVAPFEYVILGTRIDNEWHLKFHIFEQLYSIKSLMCLLGVELKVGLKHSCPVNVLKVLRRPKWLHKGRISEKERLWEKNVSYNIERQE